MDYEVTYRDPSSLQPCPTNARVHNAAQIKKIARSISSFTFIEPVILDAADQIVVGHARTEAAKLAGIAKIPTIKIEHLTSEQLRAYRIASNRLAELAGWDDDLLRLELAELDALELDFALTDIGFDTPDLDKLLSDLNFDTSEGEEPVPALRPDEVLSRRGDLWELGKHRLFVGDFTDRIDMNALMAGERARMILADVPYNLPIAGVASGLGRVQHQDFIQASGEMSDDQFTRFLTRLFRNLVEHSVDGSLHYVFMDFRSLLQLLRAGNIVYSELKAIIAWVKAAGGMGSLYRQRCEFVAVFKHGTASHVNNIELGRHGRNRTTVWEYAGLNSFQADREELLAMHPTVKPIALCADAILDVTNRGDIVLDPCVGSGTSILAAEQTGRRCYAMELDPMYADVALRRFRQSVGQEPVHAASGKTLAQLDEEWWQRSEAAPQPVG